ncbi:MAG TPA: phosphatidylglycerophosphatase A [Planctomycetota bacterium]|nr:phosphatidylglycerophosphatase A [Planctomycetota bacterium]
MGDDPAGATRPRPRGAAAWIAACFGVGFLRPAPGTWSSVAAAAPLLLLSDAAYPWSLAGGAALAYVASVALARRLFGADADRADPGWFTLDEACGVWIAAWRPAAPSLAGLALAVAFFRLFDVLKPPPIRGLQRARGGHGVVLDDAVAGVFALLASVAVERLLGL